MLTLLSFIVWWEFIGVIVSSFVIFTEIVLKANGGRDFSSQFSDAGPQTWQRLLVMISMWPAMLGIWFVAAWNRKGFVEYIVDKRAKSEQERLQKMRDFRAAVREAPSHWMDSSAEVMAIYARQYLAEGALKFYPSHTILKAPAGFMVFRMYDADFRHSLPTTVESTVEDARAYCEGDLEWLALCVPGAGKYKRALWLKLRAKLDDGSPD